MLNVPSDVAGLKFIGESSLYFLLTKVEVPLSSGTEARYLVLLS